MRMSIEELYTNVGTMHSNVAILTEDKLVYKKLRDMDKLSNIKEDAMPTQLERLIMDKKLMECIEDMEELRTTSMFTIIPRKEYSPQQIHMSNKTKYPEMSLELASTDEKMLKKSMKEFTHDMHSFEDDITGIFLKQLINPGEYNTDNEDRYLSDERVARGDELKRAVTGTFNFIRETMSEMSFAFRVVLNDVGMEQIDWEYEDIPVMKEYLGLNIFEVSESNKMTNKMKTNKTFKMEISKIQNNPTLLRKVIERIQRKIDYYEMKKDNYFIFPEHFGGHKDINVEMIVENLKSLEKVKDVLLKDFDVDEFKIEPLILEYNEENVEKCIATYDGRGKNLMLPVMRERDFIEKYPVSVKILTRLLTGVKYDYREEDNDEEDRDN